MNLLGDRPIPRILLIEPLGATPGRLGQGFREEGFKTVETHSTDEVVEALKQHDFDAVVVVADSSDQQRAGLLRRIHQLDPGLPVVVRICADGKGEEEATIPSGAFAWVCRSDDRHELLRNTWLACQCRAARRVADLEAVIRERDERVTRLGAELIDFASVVAHDLRSPLLTISGYCDLLCHEYRGKFDESADCHLQSIIDGVARMNRLIMDLLSYAKLRCINRAADKVELDQVLSDVVSNLDGAISQSDAILEIGVLPCVAGNHSQLVQLFQNLIDNAIKFRSQQRPVVRVSGSEESGGHVIRVADNGIGIDPEHQEAVFHILHRLPRSRELPGTGIGLAICKKIVECHGGRIWIESERDRGATFLVWLPDAEHPAGPGEQ